MAKDSRETVFVRDRDQVRMLKDADDWDSMTLIAVVSSDPRTFDELCRAWGRYRPQQQLAEMPWAAWDGGPPEGCWVLLDLACLRVLSGNGGELPENGAAYEPDDVPPGKEAPVVWINLPPGWKQIEGVAWPDALPPLPTPVEPLDVRGVLYGRPMAEGVARRTIDIARRGLLPAERLEWDELWPVEDPTEAQRQLASRWHELSVQVHADWLMTPLGDLEGKPPRHFLHQGREWVEREVDNRQRQWWMENRAPRAIDANTFAYRFGPLGRHEVVVYFDYCREVIRAAWDRLHEKTEIDVESLTAMLHRHGQTWLKEGSIDGDPTPPATIIETERRHLPLLLNGSHLDCECPICQLTADGSHGPGFVGFDGHHLELDDEFAFSLLETREEWEEERDSPEFDSPEYDSPV